MTGTIRIGESVTKPAKIKVPSDLLGELTFSTPFHGYQPFIDSVLKFC